MVMDAISAMETPCNVMRCTLSMSLLPIGVPVGKKIYSILN